MTGIGEKIMTGNCRESEVLSRIGENNERTETVKELVFNLQARLSKVLRPCETEKPRPERVSYSTPLAEDIQKSNDTLSIISDTLNSILDRLEV